MNRGNTLHFINRVDETNCGDSVVCPLLYYFDYFKQYNLKRHDIRFIDFDSICSTDVVIIGGGGMFDYAEWTNRAINKVLDTKAAVIGWSPGLNTHTEYHGVFETKIDFERFTLLTLRDWENTYGIDYLPDVTCKLPQLRNKYEIKRKYGIARHKDYPIPGMDYDTITNDESIDDILRFIGESEVVVSNSFHMIYWATLLGRKCVCANPFSSRFVSYRYKPGYYNQDIDDFAECVKKASVYDILDECITANDAFFEKVKRIVEDRLEPNPNAPDAYYLVTREALMAEKVRDTQFLEGDLLASQLFIDTGEGWTERNKLIAINNVYGDKLHKVRYDISGFLSVKRVRFDPIESRNCEVEIVTAKSGTGDIELLAESSVRVDTKDRFLTTDPQYIITSPCRDFVEIEFRLRILSLFEAEQNIYYYTRYMFEEINNKVAERNNALAERDNALAERNSAVVECNNALAERNSAVVECNNALAERDSALVECNNALAERNSAVVECNNALAERDSAVVECNNALAERDSAIAERDTVLNSTSWKLTAPLRAIMNFIRRIIGGKRK